MEFCMQRCIESREACIPYTKNAGGLQILPSLIVVVFERTALGTGRVLSFQHSHLQGLGPAV